MIAGVTVRAYVHIVFACFYVRNERTALWGEVV